MKNLFKLQILAFFTLASSVSFGQNLVVQHNHQEQVLYRGFQNSVAVSLGTTPFDKLTFRCVGCEILSSAAGNLIIIPGNSRTAELIVSTIADPTNEFKQNFRVQNLPNAQVFIGTKESGSQISLSELSNQLGIRYDNCLLLKGEFEIIEWEFCVDGKCVTGNSKTLSEQAISLAKNGSSTEIMLTANTLSKVDTITRKLVANYVLLK